MSYLVAKPAITTRDHIENMALHGARCTKKMPFLIAQQKKGISERMVSRCDTNAERCAIAVGGILFGALAPFALTATLGLGLVGYSVGRCAWGDCKDGARLEGKAQKVFLIYDRVVTYVKEQAEAKKTALQERFNALDAQQKQNMALAQAALKRIEEEYDTKPEVAKLKQEIGLLQHHVIMEEVCAVSLSVGALRNIQKELENACGIYLKGKEKEHQTYVELKETPEGIIAGS